MDESGGRHELKREMSCGRGATILSALLRDVRETRDQGQSQKPLMLDVQTQVSLTKPMLQALV